MKKIKLMLAVLSAALTATTGVISASALACLSPPPEIVFSITSPNFGSEVSAYDHFEFWMDENLNMYLADYYAVDKVLVRMNDGSKPLVSNNEGLTVEKLTKAQLAEMILNHYDSFIEKNVEATDDVYCISGFGSKDKAEKFCEEIFDENTVDYAQPVILYEYGKTGVGKYSVYGLSKKGIDVTDFQENLMPFTFSFNDGVDAENFDFSSIEGFEEILIAKTVKDNKVYFQLSRDEPEKMIKVLNELKNSDEITDLYVAVGLATNLSSVIGSGQGIPMACSQGDVNRNGSLDLQDAVSVAKHLVTKSELDEAHEYLADFDENDKVDLHDVIGIAKSLL